MSTIYIKQVKIYFDFKRFCSINYYMNILNNKEILAKYLMKNDLASNEDDSPRHVILLVRYSLSLSLSMTSYLLSL